CSPASSACGAPATATLRSASPTRSRTICCPSRADKPLSCRRYGAAARRQQTSGLMLEQGDSDGGGRVSGHGDGAWRIETDEKTEKRIIMDTLAIEGPSVRELRPAGENRTPILALGKRR